MKFSHKQLIQPGQQRLEYMYSFKGGEAWNQMAKFTARMRQIFVKLPNQNLLTYGGANV